MPHIQHIAKAFEKSMDFVCVEVVQKIIYTQICTHQSVFSQWMAVRSDCVPFVLVFSSFFSLSFARSLALWVLCTRLSIWCASVFVPLHFADFRSTSVGASPYWFQSTQLSAIEFIFFLGYFWFDNRAVMNCTAEEEQDTRAYIHIWICWWKCTRKLYHHQHPFRIWRKLAVIE